VTRAPSRSACRAARPTRRSRSPNQKVCVRVCLRVSEMANTALKCFRTTRLPFSLVLEIHKYRQLRLTTSCVSFICCWPINSVIVQLINPNAAVLMLSCLTLKRRDQAPGRLAPHRLTLIPPLGCCPEGNPRNGGLSQPGRLKSLWSRDANKACPTSQLHACAC